MKDIAYTPITDSPVPDLIQSQLAEQIADFNPEEAFTRLKSKEGQRVIGADFGGDKGLTQLYVIKNGRLTIDDSYKDYVQSTHGDGYLESLEKTAAFATTQNIPVGISWGAPLDGTKPLYHPKADHFLKELKAKYDNDFKNIVPTLTACQNDGPAGLISGIIEVGSNKNIDSVLFPINGGGLGMAALVRNGIYATEAGHVEAEHALNTYGQEVECGVYGATYICLEKLGANKSGIEAQWEARHEFMRARDIEDRFKEGNVFAGDLYDHSAWIVAHIIVGTAQALNINLVSDTTAIVGHGGAFKFPNYGERIQQIIEKYTGKTPLLIMTQNYGTKDTNACLDGAALASVGNPYKSLPKLSKCDRSDKSKVLYRSSF
jgi:predicted NBD/HSP70 family sugar kinase